MFARPFPKQLLAPSLPLSHTEHSLSDCGWRHGKRDVLQGVADSDTCAFSESCSDGDEASCAGCQDTSDFVGILYGKITSYLTTYSKTQCGRGTDTSKCRRLSQESLSSVSSSGGDIRPGSMAYANHHYREKAIYIGSHEPGGGDDSCVFPSGTVVAGTSSTVTGHEWGDLVWGVSPLWPDGTPVGNETTLCSDGGEGSFRIPFLTPHDERNPGDAAVYYEYACKYGSQHSACGERPKNKVRELRDELDQPTGPEYPLCTEASNSECCRIEHYFAVTGLFCVLSNLFSVSCNCFLTVWSPPLFLYRRRCMSFQRT